MNHCVARRRAIFSNAGSQVGADRAFARFFSILPIVRHFRAGSVLRAG